MRYETLARQIEKIDGAEVVGEVGPSASRYPFYKITRGRGMKVLLLGSLHGDEPAGAHSLVEFFNGESGVYEDIFEFTAFPCVNPWGFDWFRHGNGYGFNLNREFKNPSPAEEIYILQKHLERYATVVDLHETMAQWERVGHEPHGPSPEDFFLYETCEVHSKRIGRSIVADVEAAGYPVCKWPYISSDRNNHGVIWYPDDCNEPCYAEGTASDLFLVRSGYTDHAFTIETMRNWPMQCRVNINMIVIRTILKAKT